MITPTVEHSIRSTRHLKPLIFLVFFSGLMVSPAGAVGKALYPRFSASNSRSLGISDVEFNHIFDFNQSFWCRGYTGKNITIGILDTGINEKHEVFNGKTVYWTDVTFEKYQEPIDLNGHGTMCASIAAGNSPIFKGVAIHSDLVAIKMFYPDENNNPTADNNDAIEAVDYILNNAVNCRIKVVSMSWGDDNESDGTDDLSTNVERLVDAGITVVVAAGNVHGDVVHVASPGAARKVITVGAFDNFYNNVASFSLPGPTKDGRIKPDVIAPGINIMGADFSNNTKYRFGSGTSYATPIVSGISALLLEMYPSLTPLQLKNLLCLTALECEYPFGKPDNKEGWGIVNPDGAVMALNNFWSLEKPLLINFNLTSPSFRSYFTRVKIRSEKTSLFKLEFDDDVGSTASPESPSALKNLFEAYLFDVRGFEDGTPHLLARSHDGIMYFTPNYGQGHMECILAIKPLPEVWLGEEPRIKTFTMHVSHAYTLDVEISLAIGIFNLSAAIGLTFAIIFPKIRGIGKKKYKWY
ncbi:MAG: S8 family serine peptidase [Promethearchaeota archaeon]